MESGDDVLAVAPAPIQPCGGTPQKRSDGAHTASRNCIKSAHAGPDVVLAGGAIPCVGVIDRSIVLHIDFLENGSSPGKKPSFVNIECGEYASKGVPSHLRIP